MQVKLLSRRYTFYNPSCVLYLTVQSCDLDFKRQNNHTKTTKTATKPLKLGVQVTQDILLKPVQFRYIFGSNRLFPDD